MTEYRLDFNKLQDRALQLSKAGQHVEALAIYFFMIDGDNSLDGGYYGRMIAQCYEALGRLNEAKYWYGRCIEESGGVLPDCDDARRRLVHVTIDDLIRPHEYKVPLPEE